MDSWVQWVALFLATDCAYYWFHRMAHEWHWMWSAHSVHHSGEFYNFALALRQGALQSASSSLFYLPLALFFSPPVALAHRELNTLYQFWIHNSVVGHLGPLEHIFNTASHHRVHHRPPGNCNYAGVLIVWDRMFGTFQAETQRLDLFGLAKSYETWDPVWANVEHAARMVRNSPRRAGVCSSVSLFLCTRRTRHKWTFDPCFVFRPLLSPQQQQQQQQQQGEEEESRAGRREGTNSGSLWSIPTTSRRPKYSPALPASTRLYCAVNYLWVFSFGVWLQGPDMGATMKTDPVRLAAFSLFAGYCMATMGRLLDGRGQWLESVRLLVLCAAVCCDYLPLLPSSLQYLTFPALGLLCGLWVVVYLSGQR
eukprot:CAMPEP_0175139806 /NCGR_PEP_ID=MMETSP0087-20121206/11119_1 /TAXON_ID=136419 /ORGANISM="Unknown Unknown, Strain D1" /LENGTH=366 /DNA_ID=CAMNT_0016422881 /DNA_START=334 /DNA_END=1434 /DNA_ORIENTATION=-